MAKIIIPTPLRKFTQQNRQFATDRNNLSDAIQDLVQQYPDVKNNLLDEKGKVRSFIKIYIGDEEVDPDENGSTKLSEDTEVSIVPAIAGGRGIANRRTRNIEYRRRFYEHLERH